MDRRSFFVAAALVALLPSCGNGSDDAHDGSAPMEPDAEVCVAPGDSFSIGISKTSPEGGVRVAIDDANPAPPGIGKNEWKLAIKDGSGEAIAGAAVNLTLYMPWPHDHSMAGTIGVDLGGGGYSVTGLNFTMPGLVHITVEVTPPGGQVQKVLFPFCVQRKGN